MLQLNISDFLGWEIDKIAARLKAQPENDFELIIPTGTGDGTTLADEYLLAAFVGQKLSECCEGFDYEQERPGEKSTIAYYLEDADTWGLADAINYLSPAFGTEYSEEYYLINEAMDLFAVQVEAAEILPACPYFMELYAQHNEEEE